MVGSDETNVAQTSIWVDTFISLLMGRLSVGRGRWASKLHLLVGDVSKSFAELQSDF